MEDSGFSRRRDCYRYYLPVNEIGSNGSPFVPTFAKIGIAAAAGIINFVVLTAALWL
ncbi:hypothetical protein MJ572_19635 [Escherichia coli]|nr:hypothetical protein MJ572_19635 [Escherichia coli]